MPHTNFDSVITTINDRIKNPALFSLLCILIFRNWKLFLILFNLGEFKSVDCKTYAISSYFEERSIFDEILLNIFFTACLVIISISVIFISEILLDGYYKYILKFWKRLVDRTQIVIKSDIDLFKKEKFNLIRDNNKLIEENTTNRKKIIEYEDSNAELLTMNEDLKKINNNYTKLERDLKIYRDSLETLSKEFVVQNSLIESIFTKSESNTSNIEDINYLIKDIRIESHDRFINTLVTKYYSILNDDDYDQIFTTSFGIFKLDKELITLLTIDNIICKKDNYFEEGDNFKLFKSKTLEFDPERFNKYYYNDLPF